MSPTKNSRTRSGASSRPWEASSLVMPVRSLGQSTQGGENASPSARPGASRLSGELVKKRIGCAVPSWTSGDPGRRGESSEHLPAHWSKTQAGEYSNLPPKMANRANAGALRGIWIRPENRWWREKRVSTPPYEQRRPVDERNPTSEIGTLRHHRWTDFHRADDRWAGHGRDSDSPRHYFVRSACARLNGAGAVSGQRRDAASPRRQVENCAAGVPIGGGALSTLAGESPVQARDPRQARGSPEPEPPP
jgi:hypothetical protein